ncbi:trichohyalin-like [Hibiscus syriacus]|uniref:trichohyalin-like n=1 Tax=Hibiscus syriacus TaxID=106335 RepID=UPI0019239499|nr:trichohyalin-like [Hibiscus syriacus]
MGKKKVTPQSNDPKLQNPSHETHHPSKDSTFTKSSNPLSRQSSIEDPKEKLQNLKSLNSLLVKEAFESRQQIESLAQAKEALEAELSEKKKLEAEESDKDVSFEFQCELFSVYTGTQMLELGVEMEKMIGDLKRKVNGLMGSLENERERLSLVYKERDLVRKDFELQVNEGKLMKEKLMEMEENQRKFVQEVGKLKAEYDRLVREKDDLEKVKSLIMKDRDLLQKNMNDAAEEVGNLRRENEKIVREKRGIEVEKNEQRLKIDEMEKEMREMNEVISSLRKGDGILRSKIFELENNYCEAMDREAERAIEIGALVEEKERKRKEH